MGASQLTDTNNDLLLRRDHYYELLLQTGLFVLEHVYCFPSRCSGSGLNGEEVSRTSLVGGVEGHGDCSPLSFRAMLRGSVTG